MQRDKKLFRSGLHNRLIKLHDAGALLTIVDSCCRAIKLEDPQKLAEIVEKLVAVTHGAVEQKRFVDVTVMVLIYIISFLFLLECCQYAWGILS
jgi:hypothetical protein